MGPTFSVVGPNSTTSYTATPDATGTASVTVSNLPVGAYTFTPSYSGIGADWLAATGVATQFAVAQDSTKTSLTSSASPGATGQNVTFTASVTADSPGSTDNVTPTGAVSFYLDTSASGTPVATVSLVDGAAQYTTSDLTFGTRNLIAKFNSSDSGFGGSVSETLYQAVKESSTTLLTSPFNPSFTGQPVTFTATVINFNPSDPAPTGSVTFSGGSGGTLVVPLVNGVATYTDNGLSSVKATYSLLATYNPDGNHVTSSKALTQTVHTAPTSLTVTASSTNAVFGQLDVFTATVASLVSGAPTPSGSVTFTDANGGTSSAMAVNSGIAAWTESMSNLGTHIVTAIFTPSVNTGVTSSISPPTVVIVDKTDTATSLQANPTVSDLGATVTLQATVACQTPGSGTPTGSVNFMDGTTFLGSATLSGGSAALIVATLPAGSRMLTATYVGDASHNGSTGSATKTVKQASTTTSTPAATPNVPSMPGDTVAFTATISSAVAGFAIAGTADFFVDGNDQSSVDVIDGLTTFNTNTLSAGPHIITVQYNGDNNFAASASGALSYSVIAGTTTSISSSLASLAAGQTDVFTATVTSLAPNAPLPTGSVTFSDQTNGATSGPISVSGNSAAWLDTMTGAGNHVITATFTPDAGIGYTGSSSASSIVDVTRTDSTTRLQVAPDSSAAGATVSLQATVSPATAGGSVTFLDGAVILGTVTLSGGGATLDTATLAMGSHHLSAVFTGDGDDNGSMSSIVPHQVTPPTIDLGATSITDADVGVTYTQSLYAIGGQGAYHFVVAGGALPVGLTLSDDGVLSGAPTRSGDFHFTVTATDSSPASLGGPFSGSQAYTLTVDPNPAITVGPLSFARWTINRAYTGTIAVTGGTGVYSGVNIVGLPAGLTASFNGGSILLGGTPTRAGSFTFSLSLHDSLGVSASQRFTFNVDTATVLSWTGRGSDDLWSDPRNWSGRSPVANDTLLFGPNSALPIANNDLKPGTPFYAIVFNDAGQVLAGNNVRLTRGFIASNRVNGINEVAINVALAGNQTWTIDGAADVLKVEGAVSGPFGLTKIGSGTLDFADSILSVPNTYTGPTTLNGGVLQLDRTAAGAIAGPLSILSGSLDFASHDGQIADTATVSVAAKGSLNLNDRSDKIGNLVLTGGAVTTGTGVLTVGNITSQAASASATIAGNLDLGGLTRTVTVANGNPATDLVITATITNGGLTKAGPGTLALSAANLYTGATTLNAGTVLVANTTGSATGSGRVTVNKAATLGGTGSVGAVQVNAGGLVAPGAATLTAASITFAPGGLFNVTLSSTANNQLVVTGAVNLSNAILSATVSSAPPVNVPLTIIANLGLLPVTGTFASLPEGAMFALNGKVFKISYKGGVGRDVTLTRII